MWNLPRDKCSEERQIWMFKIHLWLSGFDFFAALRVFFDFKQLHWQWFNDYILNANYFRRLAGLLCTQEQQNHCWLPEQISMLVPMYVKKLFWFFFKSLPWLVDCLSANEEQWSMLKWVLSSVRLYVRRTIVSRRLKSQVTSPQEKETPLQCCARQGHIETASLLLLDCNDSERVLKQIKTIPQRTK